MTKKEKLRLAEEAYLKKILGFEYEEVKTIDEYDRDEQVAKRKVETVKKYSPPDSTALLAYLKENAPKKWDKKARTDDEFRGGVVILPEVEEIE